MLKIILLIIVLNFAKIHTPLAAIKNTNKYEEIYRQYKNGAYGSVVQNIETLEKAKKSNFMTSYWKALAYTKLLDFDKANVSFRKAIRYRNRPKEIYYEYGQSLYAANDLRNSRIMFARSVKENFKVDSSLFYLAYISKELKDFKRAINVFKTLELKSPDKLIKQVSMFNKAEIFFEKAGELKKNKEYIKAKIIPEFEKALIVDNQSTTAKDIKTRLSFIRSTYDLGPPTMINGRALSEKRYRFKTKLEMLHDDNVTQEADQATQKATNKDSFVTKVSAKGSYLFIPTKIFTVTPEASVTLNDYLNSDNPSVYTNDAHSYNLSLSNTIDYFFEKTRSTFYFDLDFNESFQDHDKDKKKEFYGRYYRFTLKNDFNILPIGKTTIALKRKEHKSYTETYDATTDTFNLAQGFNLKNFHSLLFSFNVDSYYPFDTTYRSTTYLNAIYYTIPNFHKDYTLKLSYSLTFLDTKNQSDARGTEKTHSPSISLSKKILPSIQATLGYTYTNKSSKDKQTYAYTKNEISMLFEARF